MVSCRIYVELEDDMENFLAVSIPYEGSKEGIFQVEAKLFVSYTGIRKKVRKPVLTTYLRSVRRNNTNLVELV